MIKSSSSIVPSCWVSCDGLASHPGGAIILLITSCYRNRVNAPAVWTRVRLYLHFLFHNDCIIFFCHRYTLLIGHPPFETKSLRETYNRIRKNEYTIPSRIPANATALIKKMLQPNPADRPSLNEILDDDFFKKGFFPNRLPASSVTVSPKWSEYEKTGESEKKISKEAIKKITIALSRQMTLGIDEKEESIEKDCVNEQNGEYLGKVVSPCGKDSGLSEISESSYAPRDTGQEGMYVPLKQSITSEYGTKSSCDHGLRDTMAPVFLVELLFKYRYLHGDGCGGGGGLTGRGGVEGGR